MGRHLRRSPSIRPVVLIADTSPAPVSWWREGTNMSGGKSLIGLHEPRGDRLAAFGGCRRIGRSRELDDLGEPCQRHRAGRGRGGEQLRGKGSLTCRRVRQLSCRQGRRPPAGQADDCVRGAKHSRTTPTLGESSVAIGMTPGGVDPASPFAATRSCGLAAATERVDAIGVTRCSAPMRTRASLRFAIRTWVDSVTGRGHRRQAGDP
jgi:hypothetical protein